VFDNRVQRRIFGPKRARLTGEWRKLHNEGHNDLYCSPNIVRGIKSRKIRWAGMQHVWGRTQVCIVCWWENLREKDHLEEPGVDRRIILKWIFRK
jgi:hypothetical protein